MNNKNIDIVDLSVKIGRINLKNPVITCSGTFASGIEYSKFYDISKLGAITTKSFSLNKKHGNPAPRLWETAAGLLNSIGLQNEGIDFFIDNQLEAVKKLGAEIILSIFGQDLEEFKKVALKLKAIKSELLAIELNFSCPNVKEGGMAFCVFPGQIKEITQEINAILDMPVIAKISPNFNTINEAAMAAKEGGADAVSLINTLTAAAFDIETFKPRVKNIIAGLSGPAIKPVAVLKIYQLAKEKILPVIGMGGVSAWEDAIEFLIAGASAVGVGTSNFIDPLSGEKIINGITDFLNRKNIPSVKNLIGAAL